VVTGRSEWVNFWALLSIGCESIGVKFVFNLSGFKSCLEAILSKKGYFEISERSVGFRMGSSGVPPPRSDDGKIGRITRNCSVLSCK